MIIHHFHSALQLAELWVKPVHGLLVKLALVCVTRSQHVLDPINKFAVNCNSLDGIAQPQLTTRHPRYLSLALRGIGMAILWPRFIVIVSLSVMFVLYYYPAKDEERRMLSAYGESYGNYMSRTGRFLPRSIERFLPAFPRVLAQLVLLEIVCMLHVL